MPSTDLAEYIGVESCVDLKPDVDYSYDSAHAGAAAGGGNRRKRRDAAEKEYPPPIPSLACFENLPPRMPWTMKKYCTSDGGVVIKEERVRRPEYFIAHRSDGRLVLSLVSLDDVVEESAEVEQSDCREDKIDGGDEGRNDPTVEDALLERFNECSNNNGVRVNPCGGGFGVAMAVEALPPPLHT